MQLAEFTRTLEQWAPLQLQEDYDNCGLLVGDPKMRLHGVLTTLDCTEAVVDEAMEQGCNLIVAHHPILFAGIKNLRPDHYVQRTLLKAIRHQIAIYAAHTNLDHLAEGVNGKLSQILGLQERRILKPQKGPLRKLVCYVPEVSLESGRPAVDHVRDALFAAGAGQIGDYDQCSFGMPGTGTFRPLDGAQPFMGQSGERSAASEFRIEVIYPRHIEARLLRAMIEAHPYQEVAHDIIPLANMHPEIGAGMIGDLPAPMLEEDFLVFVKEQLRGASLRHSPLRGQSVSRVALCGGAGFFLFEDALKHNADALITADLKYHQFFEADGRMLLVDPGHYESEQFTIELLQEKLMELFPNFAVLKSTQNTNPVNYY